MKMTGKKIIGAVAAVALLSSACLFVKPAVVREITPVLQEVVRDRVNGTLTWGSLNLNAAWDLEIRDIQWTDEAGGKILSAPSVTIGWTVADAFSAWKNGTGAAGALRDVRVEAPALHVMKEEDGTWNVQHLLKPQPEETASSFRGRVLIEKGGLALSPDGSHTYQLHDLGGQVSWLSEGQIDAVLEGAWESASFHVRGTYTDDSHFRGEAETGNIPLAMLQPVLDAFPETAGAVSLQGGTGRVTGASVWKNGDGLSYHIRGRAEGASLQAKGYAVTEGTADFDVFDGGASITSARARVNGEALSGDMKLNWKEGLLLNGTVELHQAEIARWLPGEDLAGKVTGTVSLSGSLDDLSAAGDLSLSDGKVRGIAIEEGRAAFSLMDHTLSVTSFEARALGGTAAGTGRYDLDTGAFQAELTANHADVPGAALGIDAGGRITGTAEAAGYFQNGSFVLTAASGALAGDDLYYEDTRAGALSGSFDYDGSRGSVRFYGEKITVKGTAVDSVSGEAEGNGETWSVPYLNGTMGSGAFSLRGTYDRGALDFTGQAMGVDVAPFGALIGENIGGTLSLSGRLEGRMEAPVFSVEFSGQDGYVRGAEIQRLSGKASSDGQWLFLSQLTADTATGTHTLTGRIGLSGEHALELEETSRHTRIENLLHLAGVDYPLTGWIQNRTSIRGTAAHPEVSGRFMAWDGSAAGELYQSASADYTLQNDTLHISNGLAYIYGGTASLSGIVSKDVLDLDMALVDVELDRILRGRPVKGKATFRGHVQGAAADPRFEGYLESQEISIGDASISQVTADLFYEDSVCRITRGFFRQRDGRFQWDGLINANTGAVNGNLQFQGWDLSNACYVFALPVKQVSGKMDGGMQIRGTLDEPDVSLHVGIDSGALGHIAMGRGTMDLSYSGNVLSIRDMRLPVGNGLLAARGTVHREGDLDLSVAARDLDLSWIPEVTGMTGVTLGGQLTAGMDLSGTVVSPRADISITVDRPMYNDIGFDNLSLMGNVSDGTVRISQALATKGQYKASARGSLPVSAVTRIPDGRDIPFDLSADLDNADLNALVFFAKPVTSASGPIKGHIQVAGPWDDPLVYGGVTVADGQITVQTMAEPITHIDGQLLFNGKSTILDGQASLGGGTASLSGRLAWDRMKLAGYAGEAHIHAPKLDSVYYKGALDADLTASEERGLPKVAGTVNVQNATIDIPMTFDEGGAGPDVLMDIAVNVGDRVRLYNSLLYDMTVRGNVHAMGLVSRPVMSGKVDVLQGTVRYLANEFNITEGTAVWGGVPDSFLPVLNVRANSSVGHYKIGMELKGPPGNFHFDLHSEPALNDSQIVTLLTLRQAPGSEGDETTGALFNAGLQMAFSGGVQDFLKNSFGLDLISVTTSLTDYYDSSSARMNDDYYYIKIGKYLFHDFMLTATMGVNNDEQSFGFRYDLKSRIGLAAWYNNDHDSYIGADYQFRF